MALSRKKKIIIGVSALVVLVLVVVISVVATRKDEPEVTTVKIDVRPELKSTVTASGEVRPVQYIKLTSEVPGRILEIYVNPGDIVKKNQALVRVDPTQLQSSQEAQWAATQASLSDVQNSHNAVASAQQGLAVKEAVERANQQRAAVKEAQTSVKTSEMRASQQQAMLRGQSSQRQKATQYSPLNGVVADIPTRVGEFAVSQLSSTPLMTIADMSTINVEVNVDETEIASVEVGQHAKIKVDALGEKELDAVVTQKNPL